jgi:hypothetical protein
MIAGANVTTSPSPRDKWWRSSTNGWNTHINTILLYTIREVPRCEKDPHFWNLLGITSRVWKCKASHHIAQARQPLKLFGLSRSHTGPSLGKVGPLDAHERRAGA